MISIKPIPAFQDNYIWAVCNSKTKQCVVVDPGDATPVIDFLSTEALTLSAILITHHHPDHVGGLPKLLAHFDIPIYGPVNPSIPQISHRQKEGDSVNLPDFGLTFKVMEVPGHTLDHIAFYSDSAPADHPNPILFCGDTLFRAGCGRLFEGTPEQMHASLQRLADLPAQTAVYCTHEYTLANLSFAAAVEPHNSAITQAITNDEAKRADQQPTLPSSIEQELAINPFLRAHQTTVKNSMIEQTEGMLGETATPTEVFAAVRAWKDNF